MPGKSRVPIELFTDKGHYLGRPADYDDKIVKRRVNLVEAIPGFLGKSLSLLDVGCGNGASMTHLNSKVKSCLGIDIENSYEQYFNFPEHPNCSFIQGDILDLETVGVFDRIISFETIEHLEREDLSFFYNSLKKDGLIAITVPNKWWIFETHGAKLPLLPWNRVPFFSWLPTKIHEKYANARIYTKNRIIKLLESQRFRVLDCKYITAPMDVLPKGAFKDTIVKWFFNKDTTGIPFKSTSIFVVASKH